MPTIVIKNGFRIVIYPDDHLPPHVHVFKSDQEVKINLGDVNLAPSLIEVWMNKKDTRKAFELVIENQEILIEAWREIHG